MLRQARQRGRQRQMQSSRAAAHVFGKFIQHALLDLSVLAHTWRV